MKDTPIKRVIRKSATIESATIESDTEKNATGKNATRKRNTIKQGDTDEKRGYKKQRYKKRRRRRYKKRWGSERPVTTEQARSFPVLVRINEDGWYPGCKIDLRVFGRGVPRRWGTGERDAGFAAYVRRKGAATYLRLSRKYHVTSASCSEPGLRIRARWALDKVLERAGLSGAELGVARGLLLGRSGFLFGKTKQAARELGILHVFAASGLHMGIFFACLAVPLGRLRGRRHWLAMCAPLPFCLAYLWLLDFPVSLTRAFVFVSLYALQSLAPVYMSASERLLNTALAALLIAPREMCSPSGALSFGAVSGILFFYPVLQNEVLRPRRLITTYLCAQFAVSSTATIGTAPVLLHVFGTYSYGAPLANLIMVPLVGLLLPLLYCLVAFDLAGAPEWSLLPLRLAVDRGLSGFTYLTNDLGVVAFYREYGSILAPPAFYCLILLALLSALAFTGRRGRPAKKLRRVLRWLALLTLLLLGPGGYFAGDLLEKALFFLLAK